MNDGWLCDSILNAAHHPSPMSTIPAFSPGPCTRHSPSVGSRRRWTLDDLYEQCSDHITEKIPNSVRFGSRPINCLIRSYSSGVMLCWSRISGVIIYKWGVGSGEWGVGSKSPIPHSLLPTPIPSYALSLIISRKDSANERKSARPSLQPSALSEARSGWGIMPSTFPSRFVIPAMLLRDPFGFDSSVTAPLESQ